MKHFSRSGASLEEPFHLIRFEFMAQHTHTQKFIPSIIDGAFKIWIGIEDWVGNKIGALKDLCVENGFISLVQHSANFHIHDSLCMYSSVVLYYQVAANFHSYHQIPS